MNKVIADTRRAVQHWERRRDPLPYLMVPMSDGNTVRYNPEIRQPRPLFREALDHFTNLCIGYERKDNDETDL